MDPGELLGRVSKALSERSIAFFVTGSTATIAYGEPRFTNDIDLVVRLGPQDIPELVTAFDPDEFYLEPESVARAVSQRASFNLIHPASGLKVDFMVADDSSFNESRFHRVRHLEIGLPSPVPFASPEDVIVKKLVFYRDGGSPKHLRDIAGVLRTTESIDDAYIESWAEQLGVIAEWREALALAGSRPSS